MPELKMDLTLCRFIYSGHSEARLYINRVMFVRLMTYYQVMPSYLDFVSVFGTHRNNRESNFSGFRDQVVFAQNSRLKADELGRSGRQFQLCWNLKSPSTYSEGATLRRGPEKWTIRQGAFHHQLDIEEGTTLWIITKASLDLKSRVEDVTGKAGNEEDRDFSTPERCLKSSFAVHLLLAHWATEKWRPYFQWLENEISDKVGCRVPLSVYMLNFLFRLSYQFSRIEIHHPTSRCLAPQVYKKWKN